MRLAGVLALGLAGVFGLLLIAVAVGSTPLSVARVVDVVLAGPGTDPISRIVFDLRLPRALLAVIVGAGLGMVGTVLQTLTRNDLADPFLFGLSSGAAAGAVVVITVTGNVLGFWTLPAAAFAGGLIASLIVLGLFGRLAQQGASQMVLAGLAVSFLFLSLTYYLIFAGDQRAAHSVLFWTLGGLGLANWDVLPIAGVGLAAIGALAVLAHRPLDALLAGDDAAVTLGVNVTRFRQLTFLICAFATASFVALSGVIGFIGIAGAPPGAWRRRPAAWRADADLGHVRRRPAADQRHRGAHAAGPAGIADRRADHLDRRDVRAVPGAPDAVTAAGAAGFASARSSMKRLACREGRRVPDASGTSALGTFRGRGCVEPYAWMKSTPTPG